MTEVIRAAGAVGCKHISSYHRFFSRARWTTDEVGLTLADLVVGRLVPKGVIRLVVDDTLGRHTGTDPTLSPRHIIESFSRRWSLEVSFHEAKGKLGFEDPQNRTERAVERTAPLALISYSLTVLWYVQAGQRTRAARLATLPWYTHKAGTTFSDMLATLRRASWSERLFDPASSTSDLRKRLRPLVDYVASAA